MSIPGDSATPTEDVDGQAAGAASDETTRQIRGSGLLLIGRIGSVGINILTQILVARYLSKGDFGAFAYALSVVALVETFVRLGLNRAIPRFLPVYAERGQRDHFFGTLAFVVVSILGLGVAVVLLVQGLQGALRGTVITDPLAASLLVVLVLLAPLDALDAVLTDVFAVFSRARAIFLRKYLLAPGLRLAVVVLLAASGQNVHFMAVGYVVVGILGMTLYVGLLPAVLRETTLLTGASLRRLRVSVRGVLAYTLPLLSTDLVLAIMGSIDALVLGFTHGTEAVGSLRVVESAARANGLVFTAFGTLFVPVAARYMARGDRSAMHDLYWRTAAWIAVLSFPIFALTFSLADSITVLLYEERYRSSAVFLAVLSLGRFIDAALGANGQTLRLFGSTRAVVGVNLFAASAHLILAVLLIPPFGALGAALAVLMTFVVYNGAKQVMLQRTAGIPLFDLHYLPIYRAIALGAIAVATFDIVFQPPLVVSLAVAGLASLAVLRSSARLRIHETFPELSRIPFMKFLR